MTHRLLPALVTALGVLAFLIVQNLASLGLDFGLTLAGSYEMNRDYLWFALSQLWQDVPIAVGVFLVLWLLPVRATSTLAATIWAGILAAVGGGVVLLVAMLLVAEPWMQQILMMGVFTRYHLGLLVGILHLVVTLVPLTVLAALLLRQWSRSKAPVDVHEKAVGPQRSVQATRRAFPALVAALGVLASLVIMDLADQGLTIGLTLASPHPQLDREYLLYSLSQIWEVLPLSAGVFLVLWLVRPVTATTTLASAIGSGVLAAVGGGIVSFFVQLVVAAPSAGRPYDRALAASALGAVPTIVTLVPFTVLAAVLLREWLRSKAPVGAVEEPVAAV